jgi:hypothetical protein
MSPSLRTHCSTKENTDRTRPGHRAPGWSSVFESKQKTDTKYYYCYRYYNNLCGNFRLIPRRRSSHLQWGCCCLSDGSFRLCISRLYIILRIVCRCFRFRFDEIRFMKEKETPTLAQCTGV